MRNYQFIVRAFVGAAALTTLVAACEESDPPNKITVVATPAQPSKPEVRVETPAPKPLVEVATPSKPETKPEAKIDESIDDDSVNDLIGKSRDALSAGELNRALRLARLATKKAPNRSGAFNMLGRVQLKRGERKDAIASFEKAVELNPSSSFAENNLGLALIYDGKYDEAVDALEEATQLEPVEPYMWNNLGMAYEHLDRLEEARDAYKEAVAAAADETGGAIAKDNLTRLAGVKSVKPMKTAKAEPPTVKAD
jgi:Flp pilus assembly protein TadD